MWHQRAVVNGSQERMAVSSIRQNKEGAYSLPAWQSATERFSHWALVKTLSRGLSGAGISNWLAGLLTGRVQFHRFLA